MWEDTHTILQIEGTRAYAGSVGRGVEGETVKEVPKGLGLTASGEGYWAQGCLLSCGGKGGMVEMETCRKASGGDAETFWLDVLLFFL